MKPTWVWRESHFLLICYDTATFEYDEVQIKALSSSYVFTDVIRNHCARTRQRDTPFCFFIHTCVRVAQLWNRVCHCSKVYPPNSNQNLSLLAIGVTYEVWSYFLSLIHCTSSIYTPQMNFTNEALWCAYGRLLSQTPILSQTMRHRTAYRPIQHRIALAAQSSSPSSFMASSVTSRCTL